jgi:hypothetical protein
MEMENLKKLQSTIFSFGFFNFSFVLWAIRTPTAVVIGLIEATNRFMLMVGMHTGIHQSVEIVIVKSRIEMIRSIFILR